MYCLLFIILLLLKFNINYTSSKNVNIFGPGLKPDKIVMPARYFFVNLTTFGIKYTEDLSEKIAVEIKGTGLNQRTCRVWVNKLDRKDGTFIVRYKVYETCKNLSINIYYKSKDIKGSPLKFAGPIFADQCYCPNHNFDDWLESYDCPKSFRQIQRDLHNFKNVDMNFQVKKIVEKYHRPESTSFCHYVIKNNEIYRDCYGKHVGFNMFADNILLFLTRKVKMPDMEFVMNLGDWPLINKGSEPLAMFSWCGTNDTIDMVLPTYDITESTIENMGRVTLDTLSVQGSIKRDWSQRKAQAVWRGRDSRIERLKLVDIARSNPDLFNVSLTNFFFFRDKEAEYGPKQPHISFFKFFDYKYQINVDGTVAAYRMPYLLAGGGLVLKQDSPFYEHFYNDLKPWVHYVPVSRDLSNLVERVLWAKEHDDEAQTISRNAREFSNNYLLPQNIICYHAILFKEWSRRLVSQVKVREGMTQVPQPSSDYCGCDSTIKQHDEL